MRRILLLVTVVALMVVMLVASAAPAAFAHAESCSGNYSGVGSEAFLQTGKDRNGDGLVCIYSRNSGQTAFKDNHVHRN